jgi:hypothetical protein
MAPTAASAAPKAASGAAAASSTSAPKKKSSARSSAAGVAAGGAGGNGGTSVSMRKLGDPAAADAAAGAAGADGNSGDLFARNLSMMAVAHVARGVGFDALQKSAADALVDIFAKCAALERVHCIRFHS